MTTLYRACAVRVCVCLRMCVRVRVRMCARVRREYAYVRACVRAFVRVQCQYTLSFLLRTSILYFEEIYCIR